MTPRRIAVVIAAFDEAANIEEVHARLSRALQFLPNTRAEFIWVVEGSDGTAEIIRRLSQDRDASPSTILEPRVRRGLGAAFRLGFGAVPASSDLVVTMDADLNHHPEELKLLVDALDAADADIVIGSRMAPGATVRDVALWRRWLSATVNGCMTRVTRARVRDMSSGYRVYRASALRRIQFENDGYAFLPEILLKALSANMKVVEAPITFTRRLQGKSKLYLTETAASYLRLVAQRIHRGDRS